MAKVHLRYIYLYNEYVYVVSLCRGQQFWPYKVVKDGSLACMGKVYVAMWIYALGSCVGRVGFHIWNRDAMSLDISAPCRFDFFNGFFQSKMCPCMTCENNTFPIFYACKPQTILQVKTFDIMVSRQNAHIVFHSLPSLQIKDAPSVMLFESGQSMTSPSSMHAIMRL